MISSSNFRIFIAGVAVLSLAGCLGNSNSGGGAAAGDSKGGAGAATEEGFLKGRQQVYELGSSPNPISGTANYKGQVEVLTAAKEANAGEAVFGDLNMDINFGANVPRPISGTVQNFAGKIGGQDVKIAGTLSTANASATATNEITVSTQRVGDLAQVPGVVIPPQAQNTVITSTLMAATFRGMLDDPTITLSGEAEMTVIGAFMGDTGQGLLGSNGVLIKPSEGPLIVRGGQAYAVRQ